MKDGEEVGYILGGVCYTDSPPKGRGVTAFRAMAGVPELQFRPLPETTITIATVEESKDFVPAVVVNWDGSDAPNPPPAYPEPPKSPVLGDRSTMLGITGASMAIRLISASDERREIDRRAKARREVIVTFGVGS